MCFILCLAEQRQARYLEWMSKYRRTLQERKGGGFTELLEGRVSECMCMCVRARMRACSEDLQGIEISSQCSVQ